MKNVIKEFFYEFIINFGEYHLNEENKVLKFMIICYKYYVLLCLKQNKIPVFWDFVIIFTNKILS